MNTETGNLKPMDELDFLPLEEQKKYIPVVRTLSVKEQADMQIRKYSPCVCGSGKKFKFCCYKK